ncbi:unnamed protein product [Ceutorhynchus assimilis]|uniref:PLAT domain-containing protein n=1 Tax=Ceutorhynchus assimilis TaxID=467358 RepID=A0A9N9QP52_9CUCU|nr:unnamed protein product [Ceutorhynchus assimilis]
MFRFLIMLSLLLDIPNSSSYRDPRQSVIIPAEKCDDPNAFTMKCLDQNTQEIPSGGEVKRHEKILIEIIQIPGACKFTIPEFLLLIIPPDELFASNKVNWNDATVFNSDPSRTTKYGLEPFTIKKTGSATIQVTPVELKKKQNVADPKTGQNWANYVFESETCDFIRLGVKCDAKNFNNKDQSQKGLTFSWQCVASKGSAPQFCSATNMEKFKDRNALTIPLAATKEENIFDITLKVALSESPGFENSLTQKVRFHVSIGTLKVKCLKNCPPKAEVTLSSMSTVLKAKCFHCDPNVVITWTIKDSKGEESVDYTYLKKKDGLVFYLKAGALKKNEKYTVRAQEKGLEETSLHTEFELFTKLPAPVKNCSVDPPTGVAFETGFAIKCTYFPGDKTFEINSVKNGKTSLLAKTTNLEREVFMLPADVSILVNVYHAKIGFTQAINLPVQVKGVLDLSNKNTDAEINEAVSNKMDEALDLINQGHSGLALQGLAAIVGEYANLPPKVDDLKKSLDKAVMNVISQVNIDCPAKAQQVADTLSQITGRYNVSSDPDISAQSTALCTKAGNVLLNDAKQAKRPDLMRNQIANSVASLSLCSQAGLNVNRDSVEAKNSSVSVPEEVPVLPSHQPVESYPDYTDDEHSSENMAKFEKSTQRMEQICFTNGKMLSFTLLPEEDPIVTTVESVTIVVARMYCDDTSHLIVESPDVNLKPNTDCHFDNIPIIDILICSTKKNPFWYIDNIPMLTPVIYAIFSGNPAGKSSFDLDLFGRSPEKEEFKDALHLTLPVHENASIKLQIHEAQLPDKSIGALNEESFYEKVSTHRIFVFKNRSFSVSFENITGTDMYDIMVTNFKKPSYEQFKSLHKTITPDDNVIDITQINNYDSFWYLSLLPNGIVHSTSNKNYTFSVSTTGCYAWNVTAKQWYYACHGAAGQLTSQNITCYCTHGQIFTGYVIDNKVSFEETLILDFELELKFCWIIYGVVLVTLVLFCSLLFLYSLGREDNILDKVFFVGDIPSYYQYAYVINIKTGRKRHSGTTSNISIKLCGTEGESMVN